MVKIWPKYVAYITECNKISVWQKFVFDVLITLYIECSSNCHISHDTLCTSYITVDSQILALTLAMSCGVGGSLIAERSMQRKRVMSLVSFCWSLFSLCNKLKFKCMHRYYVTENSLIQCIYCVYTYMYMQSKVHIYTQYIPCIIDLKQWWWHTLRKFLLTV